MRIRSKHEIPEAEYYVTAEDSFMSGWGEAEGMTSLVLLPCADREEARIVADNVRSHREMRRVHTHANPPDLPYTSCHVSLMTRTSASRWYEPDAFRGDTQ